MDKVNHREAIRHHPIKTGLLILWTASIIAGIFWQKQKNINHKPRNSIQAQVLEQDNNGYYTGYYDSKIADSIPYYQTNLYQDQYQEIEIPTDIPDDIKTICRLPEIRWEHLPLPISLTGKAFAQTLSQNINNNKRDIELPDYTSLLPKSAVASIGSSAICITSARSFLNHHIGHPSNLTEQAYDFFSRRNNIRHNPETKKSDWSVRYTTHFLHHTDIWYTSQDFTTLEHIQAGDMIFILYTGSNYKHHRFREENPATHIMIGVGSQTISLPISYFMWIDTSNNDEIIRHFINQRIDKSHKFLSSKEFQRNKEHIQSHFPNLKFPTITITDTNINITGDRTVDEFGKMCFRLIWERLLQSSWTDGQDGFAFKPTAIYSLTKPELFFKNPLPYSQSIQFGQDIESSWFIIPAPDGQWLSISEKVWKQDSLHYEATMQWERFLHTIHQPGIPFPLISSLGSQAQQMIIDQIQHDLPLQIAKRKEAILSYNKHHTERTILDIHRWDNRWSTIKDQIDQSIQTYDSVLSAQRWSLTYHERLTVYSQLSRGIRSFHSDNTVRPGFFGNTLQAGEQIVIHIPTIAQHLERYLKTYRLLTLPSLPSDLYQTDYYVWQAIERVCADRLDIKNILYGIATSESPGQAWEYGYKRKQLKYISEQYLWWYGISSQWVFQMRARNYDATTYKQALIYLHSAQFQTSIQQQLHLTPWNERDQYRHQHGGDYLDQIDHIIQQHPQLSFRSQDSTYDRIIAEEFTQLFNNLVHMRFEYSDGDIIPLSFVTAVAKYDLIQKKKKFVNTMREILTLTDDDDHISQLHNIVESASHRRSIDELIRLMHHTGEKAVYQKLIILYLDQTLQERWLDINPNHTKRSLPNYEDRPFHKQYPLYIDAIYHRLQDISDHKQVYTNQQYHTAKDFLSQLNTISLSSNKVNDMIMIQHLVDIIHTRAHLTHKSIITNFLPHPSVLYTHPLFKNYIARADIDKSGENNSLTALMIGSGMILLLIGLMSIELLRKVRKK